MYNDETFGDISHDRQNMEYGWEWWNVMFRANEREIPFIIGAFEIKIPFYFTSHILRISDWHAFLDAIADETIENKKKRTTQHNLMKNINCYHVHTCLSNMNVIT